MIFYISFFRKSKELFSVMYFIVAFLACISLFLLVGHMGSHISTVTPKYLVQSIKGSEFSIEDAEVVTLGTSHNRAILAGEFGMPLIHFFTGGQNLKESLFLLDYFRNRLKRVKLILIPLTAGSLNYKSETRSSLFHNLVALEHNKFLSSQLLSNPDVIVQILSSMISRYDNWINVFRTYLPFLDDRKKISTNKKSGVLIDNRAELHVSRINGNIEQKKENISYLNEISTISHNLNACLVLYESPVSHEYLAEFLRMKPELEQWKMTIMEYVSETNHGCVYFIQELWNKDNSKNNLFYRNSDHLNEAGAMVFTKLLREKLRITNPFGAYNDK